MRGHCETAETAETASSVVASLIGTQQLAQPIAYQNTFHGSWDALEII